MTELWQPTLTPFAILAGALLAALVALAVRRDHRVVAGLALAGFAGAFASLPGLPAPDPAASAFLLVDHFAVFFIGLMLAGAFATTLLAFAYLETHRGHREEFHLLLMLATLGAMTLAAAVNFASFFLGLEILSVSLYGLIAYPHFRRQALERNRFDDQAKNPLMQRFRQQELGKAPSRGQPGRRNQAQHGLAAVGRGLQRVHPALAGGKAALRVYVQESIGIALPGQPLAQCRGGFAVGAGVAKKQARQGVGPLDRWLIGQI